MAKRVTFYIDGFNFYYGLRRTKRNEPQWGDYYCADSVKYYGKLSNFALKTILLGISRIQKKRESVQIILCPNCHC